MRNTIPPLLRSSGGGGEKMAPENASAAALAFSSFRGLVRIAGKGDNVIRVVAPVQEDRLSEQKYRQHGYQDSGKKGERPKESGDRPPKKETFGPRALQMPGRHNVSRCAQCGTLLNALPDPVGKCPKCGFELHSCKQCTYFDTSARFECTQPIAARILRKDEINDCRFYSISVRVEKQTSTPAAARPLDARQAFENLFKK